MERQAIFERLRKIFMEVFDVEDIELSDETCAEEIEEWDSLSHIQLISAIEKDFGIKFTSYELNSWIDVGEMVDCISKKIS